MSYTYKLSPKRANVEVKINSVWGTITGNISDQQDLKSELDSIIDSIPDTSNLATKDELDTKANKTDVYTKSEIDSKNYLTSESDPTVPNWAKQPNKPTYTAREVGALPDTTVIPDISPLATKEELASSLNGKADKTEVYTKSEIDNKGFLTEHQSLEDYALKTDIPDISNLAAKDEVAFKNDVYTKTEVDEKISSGGSFDSSLYYDKTSVDTLLDNKANISDIPTNTSQLVNDSGFITNIPDEYITNSELEAKGYLTEHQDISNLATKAELATKADTSSLDGKVDKVEGKSLISDSEITRLASITNYDDTEIKNEIATKANSSDVYTKTESDSKYITEHQSLENYATKDELPDISGLASKTEIPTATSQLTNDSGFITEIPSEYITETELSSSLNSKADSDSVYTKTEIDNMIGTISSTLDTLNGEVV